MKNTVFIINPESGAGKTGDLWPSLRPQVEKDFPGYKALFTDSPMHAAKLAVDAANSGARTIISVGGDGTHNEIINGLYKGGKLIKKDMIFGVLPLGTGGDFRRTLGLPRSPKAALKQIAKGTTVESDVAEIKCKDFSGSDTIRYYINVASIGFTALVAKHTNDSTKMFGGLVSYFIGTIKSMFTYRPFNTKVVSSGETLYEGRTTDISIANGRYFGGGYLVSPNSNISDGLLDIIIIKKISLLRLALNTHKLFFGTHLSHPRINSHKATEISVDGSGAIIEGDGESVGNLPCKIRRCDEKIKVLIGEDYR